MKQQNGFSLPVPSDAVMNERVKASRAKIAQWWEGKNTKPVLDILLGRSDFPENRADEYWPTPDCEPDMDKVVSEQIRYLHHEAYCADATPRLNAYYGSRGTPMVMSYFLGATPVFEEHTTWYDPIISDIREFDPKLDPNNHYYQKHLALYQKMLAAEPSWAQTNIPGIGDYLTNLSGLRGVQDLIFDVIDNGRELHRVREKMVSIFAEIFNKFCSLYKPEQDGMSSWMAWAPGTTYPVQCDFSVMMNPEQFKEHVMPEVDFLSQYVKYMCWHLDGFDEHKHLDTLLASPHIKAIQLHLEPSRPPNHDPCWRPDVERILGAGKSLHTSAYNLEDALKLCELYPVPGIYIQCWDKLTEENVRKVEKYFGEKVW